MDNVWRNENIMGELGSKFRREKSTYYIPHPKQYLLHLACALLEEREYFPRLQQHVLTKPHLPRATAALTKRKQNTINQSIKLSTYIAYDS